MTDEELWKLIEDMAEEYASKNEYDFLDYDEYGDITDYDSLKYAYLNGFRHGLNFKEKRDYD